MATLYAAVFTAAAEVAVGDPLQEFVVNIGASSTQSETITPDKNKRRRVRLQADADCFVHWAEDPTVLNDGSQGRPLAAEVAEYFDIKSGYKIAVIERT